MGRHAENGRIEKAMQALEGQTRTVNAALEGRYKAKMEEAHPVWPWLTTCYPDRATG